MINIKVTITDDDGTEYTLAVQRLFYQSKEGSK